MKKGDGRKNWEQKTAGGGGHKYILIGLVEENYGMTKQSLF